MAVGFLIYKWKFVNPKTDSALRIIRQLIVRGVDVYLIYEGDLDYESTNCKAYKIDAKDRTDLYSFHSSVLLNKEEIDANDLQFIVYSNVPPLSNKMLRFLDELDGPKIFNNVKGLDKVRFKTYVQELLPEDSPFIPQTAYLRHESEILEYIKNNSETKKWILKPNSGYGGENISLIHTNKNQWEYDVAKYCKTAQGTIVVQSFIPEVNKGDSRILLLAGEPIGAMKRIPGETHYLTNCHSGGRAIQHTISDIEYEICAQISKQLKKDGIIFAGVDIIGNKLLEVNGLSPGGIGRINYLNNTALEVPIVEKLLRIA